MSKRYYYRGEWHDAPAPRRGGLTRLVHGVGGGGPLPKTRLRRTRKRARYGYESLGMGVLPSQRKILQKRLDEHCARPCEVSADGNPIITGPEQHRAVCRALNMYDKDAYL